MSSFENVSSMEVALSDEYKNGNYRKLYTEEKREPKSTDDVKLIERRHRKVWATVIIGSICYAISFISLVPLSVQYISNRIAKDEYGIEYNQSTSDACQNGSSSRGSIIEKVQDDASKVILWVNIATGIPGCFTSLLVGSYSDYIGRKPIVMASMIGGFIRLFVLTFVIKFDLGFYVYYIASVADGFCGSFYTLILAVNAIIADITPDASYRALHFAVIEGLLLPTAAVGQIFVGYMITSQGYLVPTIVLLAFMIIAITTNLVFLPETMTLKRAFTFDPILHIKKVFGFYFVNRPTRKLYILSFFAFVLVALTNIGRPNVETLFEMSSPFCWDPIQIGNYTAVRYVATAIASVIFMKLMKNCVSLEIVGVCCALSGTAGFVLFGNSHSTTELYIATLVGILYMACIPIPRALLSQLTPPTEQGALFSSLSVIDTVATLVSSTSFTLIYNVTITSYRGTVFIFIAGLVFLNAIFLLAYRGMRGKFPFSQYDVVLGSDEVESNAVDQSEATTNLLTNSGTEHASALSLSNDNKIGDDIY